MSQSKSLGLRPAEFKLILRSHGWSDLSPIVADFRSASFSMPYDLPEGRGVFHVGQRGRRVEARAIHGGARRAERIAGDCLSLDVDTGAFYRALDGREDWAWIRRAKMGRFLRSPSLFEDCCKIMLTINTAWKRTRFMAEMAVENYGEPIGRTRTRAFPRPERLLEAGDAELRRILRCGFRAKFILALARHSIERPEIYLGPAWRELEGPAFAEELASVCGLGPISVGYVCRLYGRPGGFAADAYVVRRCGELWDVKPDRVAKFLERRYKPCGDFGPLVLWFELTRDWHA